MFRNAVIRLAQLTGATVLVLAIGYGGVRFLPIPAALLKPPVQSIALVDRSGTPLRDARVEERFSRELSIDEVPLRVINAVIAAEDKRFFRHAGVDWIATARALANGVVHGRVTSGASTITQ